MKLWKLAILTVSGFSAFAQQPQIFSVFNNYSLIPKGTPNFGIAQGSIFIIKGSNLANVRTDLQNAPLSTTLNGVTVQVTVAQTQTQAILYYVLPEQVAAILPSATPVGTATITVSNNGQTSAPAAIQVVKSAFGILTRNGAGTGMAVASGANSKLLGFTNAANPGDALTFWGSGIGPAPGDETIAQIPQDLTNIPVEVDIGGVPAQVLYRGRSTFPGLDQLNVIVPAGVPAGCYVSVVVRTSAIASNFATLPIAASGRTCSDPLTGLTAQEIDALPTTGRFGIGQVSVMKTYSYSYLQVGPNGGVNPNISDQARGAFLTYSMDEFAATTSANSVSVGSCIAFPFQSGNPTPSNPIGGTLVSAGSALRVSTQIDTIDAGLQSTGIYNYQAGLGAGNLGDTIPPFIPNSGGFISIQGGSSSAQIGNFQTMVNLNVLPVWSNLGAAPMIDRSQSLTVTWTGGAAGDYVQITGQAGTPGMAFTCMADASSHSFAIPQVVLSSLPASSPFNVLDSLRVSGFANLQRFTAQGLNVGLASGSFVNSVGLVTYR